MEAEARGANDADTAMALASARAQLTAIRDVLKTISRSAFDLQAVFDVVVENATKLCRGDWGYLFRREGDVFRLIASHGGTAELLEYERAHPTAITDRTLMGRVALRRKVVHIPDLFEDPNYDWPANREHGVHTVLGVPIFRDDEVVGAIGVARNERQPFSDADIRLVQTFADQATIAMENVRLFNDTRESLERQTAISEILRAIANSPSDQQPVLNAIAENAARFCGAADAIVVLARENELQVAAHHGPIPSLGGSLALQRTSVAGRAVLERRTLHVADLLGPGGEEFPQARARADATGQRALLAAPLLREGEAIGAIMLRKQEPVAFTSNQIQLVEAFADQAVIAIENVRLFNETKEALERQTATSSILNVISRSPADQQPTLDAIVESGARLCDADMAFIYVVEQGFFKLRAGYKVPPSFVEYTNADPVPVTAHRGSLSGRVVAERRAVQIPDVLADAEYTYLAGQRLVGYRAMLNVPMFSKGELIGLIGLWRTAPIPFTTKQIDLMSTFADQAVIAIENTRLFNETKEALEQQIATAELLEVISRSTNDLTPVFGAVLEKAIQLCDADNASILLREGEVYRHAATLGMTAEMEAANAEYGQLRRSLAPGRETLTGRVAVARATVQIADALSDPEFDPAARQIEAERPGSMQGTMLGVPLLREGEVIGVIVARHAQVRAFTDRQIQLLETFARQATIAIENVRLFNETKESLEQQTAVAEVLKTISRSAFDLQPVLDIVLDNAVRLAGADIGWLSRVENEQFMTVAYSSEFPQHVRDELVRQRAQGHVSGPWVPLGASGGVMGFTLAEGRMVHLADVREDERLKGSIVARLTDSRTVIGVPMLRDGQNIGGMVLARYQVRPFTEREIDLVQTFSDQAAIAIGNVRLFNEIQDKSRQLEVASRHKSEFLANMSHELRTPLNAIIGFSEVLIQGLFGDVNEKQREYLQDVIGSGQHLLSLINDILDLSKIEAGRMELELSRFSFRDALASGVTIVRERASRHNIALSVVVSDDLGHVEADERKVKQIFYNLLSNAVKFTPDGGRVDVSVRRDNGNARVEVRDNGIGIAEEDQARIFEEFQQVGRERSREGTGLGLTLTKRFVELHGGRIWLESAHGKGSTFAFTLPLRQSTPVRA